MNRRTLIQLLIASTLYQCKLLEESEREISTTEELLKRQNITFEFNGDAFWLSQKPNGEPFALNLTCTHKKCTVQWKEDQQAFICPCHKGKYDLYGKKISGKPPRDLYQYRLQTRNDKIFILNQIIN